MTSGWSRRGFLGLAAAGAAAGATSGIVIPAQAQSGNLLEKLRAQKSIKVAVANQPPYSSLNPDGSIDGASPAIVKTILGRLGITKIEASAVAYGELIPGLQAGRWDMIAASMTITKARCEQVQYSDPVVIDGACMGYVKANLANPPKTIKEAGERNLKVGALTGGYLLPAIQGVAKDKSNVTQYNDTPSLIDGLMTKRIDIALASYSAVRDTRAQRNNAYDIVFPIPDDIPHGSGPAFRKTDKELFDAFQAEYRKMKQSGEAQKIITGFGFDIPPGWVELTGVKACELAG